MPDSNQTRIALVGSYVPRKCGIATFTHDLATAIAQDVYGQPLAGSPSVGIVAMNDREGEYAYAPEVTAEIHQHRREDYRTAAEILNTSRVDVVCLQHEYGLFGGDCGDYLFELLDRLRKPVVCTLHTVLSEPSATQLEVLQRLCKRSSAVIVMASRARMLLHERYGVALEHIKVIHHGVPDIPFCECEPFKERFGLAGGQKAHAHLCGARGTSIGNAAIRPRDVPPEMWLYPVQEEAADTPAPSRGL